MKVIFIVVLVAAALGGAYFYFFAKDVPPAVTIHMKDNEYTPSDVTIKAGEKIMFINDGNSTRWPASNIHPTHEIYPEFDPKEEIQPLRSWSFRLDKPGTWYWHDHIDPKMTGKIVVQ